MCDREEKQSYGIVRGSGIGDHPSVCVCWYIGEGCEVLLCVGEVGVLLCVGEVGNLLVKWDSHMSR